MGNEIVASILRLTFEMRDEKQFQFVLKVAIQQDIPQTNKTNEIQLIRLARCSKDLEDINRFAERGSSTVLRRTIDWRELLVVHQ